jgi:1-deoxy-D-xylulose-5-phosphate synthase
MIIMAPKDAQEFRDMLYSAINLFKDSPVAIRYPRGKALGVAISNMKPLELGKSETPVNGKDIAVLAVGSMVEPALNAAKLSKKANIDCEIVNARFIKPLDTDMIDRVCAKFSKIITVEDGQLNGGFGSAVLEYINQRKHRNIELLMHGIPDRFIEHGTREELYKNLYLDDIGIYKTIKQFMDK